MTELQKAVSEAERKAHDMITSERAKMERTVAEAKRQAAEDALAVINQQEDSSEVRRPRARLPPRGGLPPQGGSRDGGRRLAEVHGGPETDSCLRGNAWFGEAWHLEIDRELAKFCLCSPAAKSFSVFGGEQIQVKS